MPRSKGATALTSRPISPITSPAAVPTRVLCCERLKTQNFITDKAQVETLLTGATFIGVYLRTESAYTLKFGTDGTLTDTTGAKARWWVDDQARYCREWLDGKLKGNTGCMNVELEDGQVALYSDGKKVVEGIVTGN